ncbi:MAG TPA: BREX system ATP-binding domain-containing protein, partial [Candidatus Kapabacteria bacterium]|nr:BREX system ATP-binding domain-containing protein [Candidatus Kapabacteria bacterium]
MNAMKVHEILVQYSDAALDKISADKLDEAVNLRLPRSVIIQEIAEALNSFTYVAKALAPTRPPTFAFLKLLLDVPCHSLPIEGFQEKVLTETKRLVVKAETLKGLSGTKNYQLYLKMLKAAWEDDVIERSEVLLLEALRNELNILTGEHLLLEHHPDITDIDDFSNAYTAARNYLLITGLILTFDNNYVLADEVSMQIRRIWGIDLENEPYNRLLNMMTKTQLYNILEKTGLLVSGSKDEQIQRIIDALITPTDVLDALSIEELRELCRQAKSPVSGLKAEVIENIITHFDQERDLVDEEKDIKITLPIEPEKRELDNQTLNRLLQKLSNDQLYDILSASYLKTGGTKEIKIKRLVESPWSEISMLNHLRRVDISNLCRKMGIQISGVKSELIDRLIEWGKTKTTEIAIEEDINVSKIQAETETEIPQIATPDVIDLKVEEIKQMPVPGLEDIKKAFPELELDEQTILSLVKETKSLTEQDIERASRRHGFEWFLTKAHMAEMLAKLKRAEKFPIHVKSVRSINIYEWNDESRQNKEEIEKTAARDVVNALRQGVVPANHLDLLAVGQENARGHLVDLLKEIYPNKSAFKFIRGHYGEGKTFLCSWLRQYALDNEYVVSFISIGPDQPLSDLPVFFSGIVNGLRTPEKRDSCALADVLESWLLSIHRKTAQIEGLKAFDGSSKETLMPLVEARIESELASISNIDSCFPPAIRAFYHARVTGDQATASNAIAWLSGSRSIPARILNEMGVRGYLEANQVFARMRALLEIIDGSRFKGLLLMVDELEVIRKFPHARQREQAFETLRLLIDE